MNYWQIAAGAEGREYARDFLRFGMAFVGGEKHIATMQTVQLGDRVILKQGTTAIVAAGTVVDRGGSCGGCGDKSWLRDFDGWDLQAYRFIEWHVPQQPMAIAGLSRGTIKRVGLSALRQQADQIVANQSPRTAIDPEPAETQRVSDETIIEFLIANGMGIRMAEDLTLTFGRIRRLANFYYKHCDWSTIREHETRTFLIVPLLLALGWVEQQIKIELPVHGGRADIALFETLYSGRESETGDCVSLIESKGFSQGLFYAPQQAHTYATSFPKCKVVFVSNGYCYKAYLRQKDGSFPLQPTAYLNIREPRDRYPLDPSIAGCLRAIELLLHWV